MSLELVIVTPEGEAYSGTVDQVVLPGSEGEFGVLEQHERYLAPLKHGAVEIRTGSGTEWAALSNGFADVSAERVVVLADLCALAADIDVAMHEEEKREVEAELASLEAHSDHDVRRAALEDMILHHEVRIYIGGKA